MRFLRGFRRIQPSVKQLDLLAETGNVIVNACLATIANVLGMTMRMSLP